jgi:hypothetical protein
LHAPDKFLWETPSRKRGDCLTRDSTNIERYETELLGYPTERLSKVPIGIVGAACIGAL